MKKVLLLLFTLMFVFEITSPVVNAESHLNVPISSPSVPTKIYATTSRSAFIRSQLPNSVYHSVMHDGYYYSGTLYLIRYEPSPANDGVTGIYGGYLYGGSATTSKVVNTVQ
ncbi:hypothetical protein ACV7JQ_07385 [Globicatella sulfidifaciens]